MIKSFLICDSNGIPFFSQGFNINNNKDYAPLFSGFISTISTIGRELFNEEIATINFGIEASSPSKIMILSRDFYGLDKKIFFIFLCEDEIDYRKVNQFISYILVEARNLLKNFTNFPPEKLQSKISRIIDTVKLFDIE